jgi:hypothetical protein
MLDGPQGLRSAPTDLTSRRQIALERIQQLIAEAQAQARRAWRGYITLQCLTVGLAAITPCLIVLAKENPGNALLNWLQLFTPAFAAIAAGVSHVFHWREDAVRSTNLVETIRSQLWRFQTRSGEFAPELSDEQALGKLVLAVDELNLQSVARWSSAQLAESHPATTAPGTSTPAGASR